MHAYAGPQKPLMWYHGQLNFAVDGGNREIKHLPTFEDFPAERISKKKATDIEWSSEPHAWSFRTRLRQGLKQGANFDGHYAVVTHGCGSPCQSNWIVDVSNGKVVGTFSTAIGAVYRLDSSLIMANMPATQEELQANLDVHALYMGVVFYTVKKDTMSQVAVVDFYDPPKMGNIRNGRTSN